MIIKLKNIRFLSIILVFLAFSGLLNSIESAESYKFDDYLKRIEAIVNHRAQEPKSIYTKQWNLLIDYADRKNIHQLNFDVENSKQKYDERRQDFDTGGVRAQLIAEWEQELGISWPTYKCENCCRPNGHRANSNCKHRRLEAHHIVPLGYNGPNKWWNIYPLTIKEHTGKNGIHSSDEAQAWFPKVSK